MERSRSALCAGALHGVRGDLSHLPECQPARSRLRANADRTPRRAARRQALRLSFRAASADRGDAASLGTRCGSRRCCSARASMSPSCSRPPTCRTASREWDRMTRRGRLSRALSGRDPAQPRRSRRCRGSRGAGADRATAMAARPMNWSARRRSARSRSPRRSAARSAKTSAPKPSRIAAWEQRARDAGMDDHQRETLIKMFQAYARDGLKGNPNVLGWLLGRPPTSLAAFAARIAAAQA